MFSQQVGLKISQKKTEVMMLNVPNPSPIKLKGENLSTSEEFTYLDSTVRQDVGAGSNIKNRLNKTRKVFGMLNNVWKSSQYSIKTKLRMHQSCLLSTFHTKNLITRILRRIWSEIISNQHLLAHCKQDSMGTIMM